MEFDERDGDFDETQDFGGMGMNRNHGGFGITE